MIISANTGDAWITLQICLSSNFIKLHTCACYYQSNFLSFSEMPNVLFPHINSPYFVASLCPFWTVDLNSLSNPCYVDHRPHNYKELRLKYSPYFSPLDLGLSLSSVDTEGAIQNCEMSFSPILPKRCRHWGSPVSAPSDQIIRKKLATIH